METTKLSTPPEPTDHRYMTPEEWAHAIAVAEKRGPLHAELYRLAQRFDVTDMVGHGIAISLIMLSTCAEQAQSCFEVQMVTGRMLQDVAIESFGQRLGEVRS